MVAAGHPTTLRQRRPAAGAPWPAGASPQRDGADGPDPGSLRDVALALRPLARADLALLVAWLAEPHVAAWWRDPADPDAVAAHYGPAIDGDDPTQLRIAELDGTPVGFGQHYRIADNPDWLASLAPAGDFARAAGIDYLIGEAAFTGRGLGTALVGLLVAECATAYPDTHSVVVAVEDDNTRSWRALQRCGFALVWAGLLASEDPSGELVRPQRVYVRERADGA